MRGASVNNPLRGRPTAAGFTLVEVIVAVGIIALLLGILVPAVIMGRRAVEKSATQQFMNTIAMGLSVYTNDFDVPPPSDASGASGTMFGVGAGTLGGWNGGALMTQAATGASPDDGEKGMGFRVGGVDTGPKSGPYVEPGENDLIELGGRFYLADQWDQPIAYYRAQAGRTSLWPDGRFVKTHNNTIAGDSPSLDAHPETDETALRSAGYVLYSLGRDGRNDTAAARDDDLITLEP